MSDQERSHQERSHQERCSLHLVMDVIVLSGLFISIIIVHTCLINLAAVFALGLRPSVSEQVVIQLITVIQRRRWWWAGRHKWGWRRSRWWWGWRCSDGWRRFTESITHVGRCWGWVGYIASRWRRQIIVHCVFMYTKSRHILCLHCCRTRNGICDCGIRYRTCRVFPDILFWSWQSHQPLKLQVSSSAARWWCLLPCWL